MKPIHVIILRPVTLFLGMYLISAILIGWEAGDWAVGFKVAIYTAIGKTLWSMLHTRLWR